MQCASEDCESQLKAIYFRQWGDSSSPLKSSLAQNHIGISDWKLVNNELLQMLKQFRNFLSSLIPKLHMLESEDKTPEILCILLHNNI
jgi:hypothetical protein